MEKIYINFIYFGFTYNKDFVRLLTGQNEFIKKKMQSHTWTTHCQNSHPVKRIWSKQTPCSRPSIVQLYTLFKTPYPVQWHITL